MRNYDEVLNEIQAFFPKHHLEINIYPAGGSIYLSKCEECDSDKSHYDVWRDREGTTLNSAILKLIEEVKES